MWWIEMVKVGRGMVGWVERVLCAMGECRVKSRLTCRQGIRGRRAAMILFGGTGVMR
jgi:hypothetical protein